MTNLLRKEKHQVFDDTDIPIQALLSPSKPIIASAKRGTVERKGIHAWHPYYAGYSEAFVDSAINFLGCTSRSVILDPWGGSGTTNIVAARKGIPSISLDINPAMACFSAAKSVAVLKFQDQILSFFETKPWRNISEKSTQDIPIASIYEEETANFIKNIVDSISSSIRSGHGFTQSDPWINDITKSADKINSPFSSFLLSVVFNSLRKITGTAKLTNPTWHRTSADRIYLAKEEIEAQLKPVAEEMLKTLESFYSRSPAPVNLFSMVSDVRNMELESASIDHIVTSPPYLTRIDYAVSTSPELSLFGDETLLTQIRHKTIGAPVITKNEKSQRQEWGLRCNDILEAIAAHSAKASKSYYWKNITQYFMDIDDALIDIHRILKNGASGLVVVQSSYFKEIEIPLGEIYVDMAKSRGFDAKIAFRQEVKGHMAHVNTKSSIYKTNKIYFEDAIHIVKK